MTASIDDFFVTEPKPPRRQKSVRRDLEGGVVRECLAWLHTRPNIFYIERRNTGAVAFSDGGFVRFGSKGAADIWCLVMTNDVGEGVERSVISHVEIECKRRDGKGRLSDAQREFKRRMDEAGVTCLVVTSAEELEQKFRENGLT